MDDTYEIIETLGEGSFGSVYLVRDNKGQTYALKSIPVNPFDFQKAMKQIEVMQKLHHENLVRIYNSSLDESTNHLLITMQYCESGDLLNYYKHNKKTLNSKSILKMFFQIVKAFVFMNIKGVIHRDLKPENILINKDLVLKIADFGCARNINRDQISKMGNFSLQMGTTIYAPPQQLMNQKYSAKCDVWSAGCLLFLISFGYHPFMDSKAHNILILIEKLTKDKEIQLPSSTDSLIAEAIKLSLVYSDHQRATWRELSLCRIFCDRIRLVKHYLLHLRHITMIANWLGKQFWRCRKHFAISDNRDHMLAYFLTKYQYTSLKMAKDILAKCPKYKYLFEEEVYKQFQADHQITDEITKNFQESYNNYGSIRKKMQNMDVFQEINQRQTNRISCFSDLDNSMRAAYRVLVEIVPQLQQASLSNTAKVWPCLARWITFERWYSYEQQPRVQRILSQYIKNPIQVIKKQIQNYEAGAIQ